jgi:hypothetical protein
MIEGLGGIEEELTAMTKRFFVLFLCLWGICRNFATV